MAEKPQKNITGKDGFPVPFADGDRGSVKTPCICTNCLADASMTLMKSGKAKGGYSVNCRQCGFRAFYNTLDSCNLWRANQALLKNPEVRAALAHDLAQKVREICE